ncbi:MAG: type II secretion system protein [Nitrospira sp.]|jgi:general secretion pathway protein G|nr:type II secretion system protein [Nitrospira sp.]THJ22592.1 MAG: type II secretion system protein [Nitrospira sp. CG24D]
MMRRDAGFTLIELVITIAIIGVLATAVMPMANLVSKRHKEQELRISLRQVRDAIDAYRLAVDDGRVMKGALESGYPKSLEILVEGVEDAKNPKKTRIYFLRRVPRDPTFTDASVPASETWGIRSYESPPDSPSPGNDVFDVFSLSQEVGLNGIPYSQW